MATTVKHIQQPLSEMFCDFPTEIIYSFLAEEQMNVGMDKLTDKHESEDSYLNESLTFQLTFKLERRTQDGKSERDKEGKK